MLIHSLKTTLLIYIIFLEEYFICWSCVEKEITFMDTFEATYDLKPGAIIYETFKQFTTIT